MVKGDGTDVVNGLWESVTGEWAGDVDLNDGKLQQQYHRYKEEIDSVGLNKPLAETRSELSHELVVVRNNLEFVFQGTEDMFHLYNVSNKLVSIRSRLLQFVKRIEHFRRVPASHVFVLMISAEQRKESPTLYLCSVFLMLVKRRISIVQANDIIWDEDLWYV